MERVCYAQCTRGWREGSVAVVVLIDLAPIDLMCLNACAIGSGTIRRCDLWRMCVTVGEGFEISYA